MFSKKILFPVAAMAMASFVACSDDSSSSAPAADAQKTDVVPASVKSVFELDNVTCTAQVNFCKTVVVEGLSELAQCNGSIWNMQVLRQPVAGCENAAVEQDAAAAPVDSVNAGQQTTEQNPAEGATTTDGQQDTAEGSGTTDGQQGGATGDVIYCVVPGVMGGCETLPAAMKDMCESPEFGGTLVESCPAE